MKKLCVLALLLFSSLQAQWTEITIPVFTKESRDQENEWLTTLCWDGNNWNTFILKREKKTATEGKLSRANKSLRRRTNNLYSIIPEITYIIDDPENQRTIYVVPVPYIKDLKKARNEYIQDFAPVSFYELEGPLGSIMREHAGEQKIVKDSVQIFLKEYLFNTPAHSKKYTKPIATLLKENKQNIKEQLSLTDAERNELKLKKDLSILSFALPVAYRERDNKWYALMHWNGTLWMPYMYDRAKTNIQAALEAKTNKKIQYKSDAAITISEPMRNVTIAPIKYTSADEIGNATWIPFEKLERTDTITAEYDGTQKEVHPLVHETIKKYLFEQKENIGQNLRNQKIREQKLSDLTTLLATKNIIVLVAYNAQTNQWQILLGKQNNLLQPFVQPDSYKSIKGKAQRINRVLAEQTRGAYTIEKENLFVISDMEHDRKIYVATVPFIDTQTLDSEYTNKTTQSYAWTNMAILREQTNKEIPKPVNAFFGKYLNEYQRPLEQFLTNQRRKSTERLDQNMQTLAQDLAALASVV